MEYDQSKRLKRWLTMTVLIQRLTTRACKSAINSKAEYNLKNYEDYTKAESKNFIIFFFIAIHTLHCKTVGFFAQNRFRVTRAKRASITPQSQPRSRPFDWLLARTWIQKKNRTVFYSYLKNKAKKYLPRSMVKFSQVAYLHGYKGMVSFLFLQMSCTIDIILPDIGNVSQFCQR